ncbi:hypothetical protein [Streptosporangium sp. V21-05]|uniref:hypothetical protein n=1 Tax=Streptosporangium sp. V21-05 TaxID=3446115 RepID=UPI003F533666
MADYEIPEDLIEAQRAFYEADERVQAATDAMPSSVAVLAREAAVSEEQREELAAARAERLRLVDVLYRHPWFQTVDDPHKARMALQKAARGEG